MGLCLQVRVGWPTVRIGGARIRSHKTNDLTCVNRTRPVSDSNAKAGEIHPHRPGLYPTRFSGTCPAKCASIPSRRISAMLIRASIVELPICGVMKTFGRSR